MGCRAPAEVFPVSSWGDVYGSAQLGHLKQLRSPACVPNNERAWLNSSALYGRDESRLTKKNVSYCLSLYLWWPHRPSCSVYVHRTKYAFIRIKRVITHWNCAHIVPSIIYANTTLRLGPLFLWNSLPTHVITAVSVDSFKNRLDKFRVNEEARFDYKANLSGSGFARCF